MDSDRLQVEKMWEIDGVVDQLEMYLQAAANCQSNDDKKLDTDDQTQFVFRARLARDTLLPVCFVGLCAQQELLCFTVWMKNGSSPGGGLLWRRCSPNPEL